MPTTALAPVWISPEARSFVERLGHTEELEKMIDRARRVVAGLRSIEVVLDEATEEMPPGVILWVHRDGCEPGNDSTHQDWIEWMATSCPPEVCQNFALLSVYHDHGR
jgi:hypothetical protein